MEQIEKFVDLPLEEVIGDRFGRYSKYIIQERALPDVRDGLKPVQRRILYAMHEEKNTHDKPFRKAAKTVGTVIGNYHPHGDSSVYEAMVRLSQDWKVRNELIEMHGNNGSVDGDPPAAMRYTEARLSAIADELLKDIDKDTVEFIPNFDDTNEEPVVLPAKFPNLLANGSTGISAGYATEIPPHHLEEVIDAVIKKIDKPDVTLDELLEIIKGPDFPTGGIVQGLEGIKEAYRTGKGKVIIRGKAKIETVRGGREQIVIDEIPYEINKANLVKRMDELRLDRKVEGIMEVRDETDRTGLRIIIELKKEADSTGILNYLYKNTDLQIAYHYNMVAIKDHTPQLLSLDKLLEAYIDHQKEVVTRQTQYDLNKMETRAHIVEGLIKAISVLDELIQLIRSSSNKQDAKTNIINAYSFSEAQAEAIVSLQLYRLTNTDVTALEKEASELSAGISSLREILNDKGKMFQVIKKDLRGLKKKYKTERKTVIEEEIEELKINLEVTVASEEVLVSVTKEGYIKRTSLRSYSASNGEDFAKKENDHLIALHEINTTDKLLLFTSKGRYLFLPVHQLPDIRWKDIGQHISNVVGIEKDEKLIKAMPIRDFSKEGYLIFMTQNGMIKRSELSLYEAQRYTKALVAINLKKDDEVISVDYSDGDSDIFIAVNTGYGLWFDETEIPLVGQRAAGVKAVTLKNGEKIVSGQVFKEESNPDLVLLTHRGAAKRMTLKEFEKTSRAKRGVSMLRELKTKAHRIVGFEMVSGNENIIYQTSAGTIGMFMPKELRKSDRYSNGSYLIDSDEQGIVEDVWVEASYCKPFEESMETK